MYLISGVWELVICPNTISPHSSSNLPHSTPSSDFHSCHPGCLRQLRPRLDRINGLRSWTNISFEVDSVAPSSSVRVLEAFLAKNFSFSPPTVIPRGLLLLPGFAYAIEAKLCNFLGACGRSTARINVTETVVPFVAILGPPIVTVTPMQGLSIAARAYTADCSESISTKDLTYSWKFVDSASNRKSNINSASTDPAVFLLPPFSLKASSSLSLTVVVMNTVRRTSSSASVSILVQPGVLVAAVRGGSAQTIRVFSIFSLDGSVSYDEDQMNYGRAGLSYKWSCLQDRPIYAAPCSVHLNSSSVASSRLVVFAAQESLDSTSAFTLRVSDGGRFAAASVSVTVLRLSAPLVSVAPVIGTDLARVDVTALRILPPRFNVTPALGAVNVNARISLLGVIDMESSGVATWTISDPTVDLKSIALTATQVIISAPAASAVSAISNSIYAVNLVVAPSSLPAGASLTFTLTCKSPISSDVSFASIDVTTNGSPRPGAFVVGPSSGTELSTQFKLATSSWTDPELPLAYEFEFEDPSSSSLLVVQAKSQATYCVSVLPAGSPVHGNQVITRVNVFDALGANSSLSSTVVVLKIHFNQTAMNVLLLGKLRASASDVGSLKQAISVATSVVNAVNCSLAPRCSLLNRISCSQRDHTCGPCVPGGEFIGVEGSSDDPCVSVRSISNSSTHSLSGKCTTDLDCSGWSKCDAKLKRCYTPYASCLSDCSGSGTCNYYSTSTGEPLKVCYVGDPQCTSQCSCQAGYHGPSCALSDEESVARQTLRGQLLVSLATLVITENANAAAVASWPNSLNSITQAPDELSWAATEGAIAITQRIIAAATSSSISTALFNVVDSLALATSVLQTTANASTHGQRRLSGTSPDSLHAVRANLTRLLDSMSLLQVAAMVHGERSSDKILSSYRATDKVLSASSMSAAKKASTDIAVPLTVLEAALGVSASSVSGLQAAAINSGIDVKIGIMSLNPAVFDPHLTIPPSKLPLPTHVANTSVQSRFASSTMRLQLNMASICGSNAEWRPTTVLMKLQNSAAAPASIMTTSNAAVVAFNTSCRAGERSATTYRCPEGNITVQCDGVFEGVWKTRCPERSMSRSCLLSAPSNSHTSVSCSLVNETSAYTLCSCQLCSPGSRHLAQASSSDVGDENFAFSVTSVATYVSRDFVSVMESAADFNSVNALKSSLIVVVTFLTLWMGVFAAVGLTKWTRMTAQVREERKSTRLLKVFASEAVTTLTTAQIAEVHLRNYVSMFFPNIFSEQGRLTRFTHELLQNHIYVAIFTGEWSFAKCVDVLKLLTILTADMFFLALFYDLEWPSDTGVCAAQHSEQACMSIKSTFSSGQTICDWRPRNEAAYNAAAAGAGTEDVSGATWKCVWETPSFDPYGMLAVSLIVFVTSIPIRVVLVAVCKMLRSPTHGDIEKEARSAERKRRVAQLRLGIHRTSVAQVQPPPLPGALSKAKSFTSVVRVDSMLAAQVTSTHRSSLDLLGIAPVDVTILRNHVGEIDEHSLVSAIKAQSDKLMGRERARFLAYWDDVLQSAEPDEEETESEGIAKTAVATELQRIQEEAMNTIESLRDKPIAHVGVQILQLFVTDLMGRESKKAKVFMNQLKIFSSDLVVTWSFKCVLLSALVVVNAYFIFTCMLYAMDKGLAWQHRWLIASVINLFVDVGFKQINSTLILHYVIPNLVFEAAIMVKMVVLQSIARLCANEGTVRAADSFSASDYLFVSTRVAREFPDLVESALVLSYESSTISAEQMKSLRSSVKRTQRERVRSIWDATSSFGWLCSGLSLTVTWILMTVGTQQKPIQNLIVNCLNPLLLGALGSLGITITHSTVYGFLLTVIFFVAVVFTSLFVQTLSNKAKFAVKTVADAEVGDSAAVWPASKGTRGAGRQGVTVEKEEKGAGGVSLARRHVKHDEVGVDDDEDDKDEDDDDDFLDFGESEVVIADDRDFNHLELQAALRRVAMRVAAEAREGLDIDDDSLFFEANDIDLDNSEVADLLGQEEEEDARSESIDIARRDDGIATLSGDDVQVL